MLATYYPEIFVRVTNSGISGNTSRDLLARYDRDVVALQPDWVSICIGINDVWHRHGPEKIMTTDAQLELNYREILKRIKAETNAKIIILSPYLLDAEITQYMKEDLVTVLPIIKGLADEYADAYIPLQELFAEAIKTQPAPLYYSPDGVHPNENGAKFIAEHYAKAVEKILN